MKRIASLALLAALAAPTAIAQTPEQDLVVTSHLGIFGVDKNSGLISTLATENSSLRFYKARMDIGNDRMMTLFTPIAGANSYLIRVYPGGTQTTLATIPGTANDLILDQDGQWLFTTTEGRLFRTQGLLNNRTVTTLLQGLGTARGLCLDQDSGDYVLSTYNNTNRGTILRVNRQSLGLTTLKTGLPQVTSIEHNQRTGHFAAVAGSTTYIVNRVGGTVTSIGHAGRSAVWIDDITGHMFIAGSNQITEYDTNYVVQRTIANAALGSITGLTMFGSRKLAPATNNPSTGGSSYRVVGYFRESRNAGYVCALSFGGMRAGLNVTPTRRINIVPDSLFFVTLDGLPFFTKNFTGVTSGIGFFAADFILPFAPASAPPLTFAAVAINPTKPGGLDVAASWTVKIEN